MEYAQLNETLSEAIQVTTQGNVLWDGTHFCPASALTPAEATLFRVVPLLEIAEPVVDPITQSVQRNGCEFVNGQWQYKWDIAQLTPEQIAANQAAQVAAIIADVTAGTQKRLDDFARTRNYDGVLSACTYASSGVPKFAGEGQYCVDARDSTWATLYTFMAEVQLGTKPMPTGYADVEPLLPPLAWPV